MPKGNVNKSNSDYRGALLKVVENDLEHPINNGIHMEAHHLISNESIKQAKMQSFLVDAGYDINHLSNLAFLPATLPGACHLNVQVHRGNHFGTLSEQDNDDDAVHPVYYHDVVRKMLIELKIKKLNDCGGEPEKVEKKLRKCMAQLSEDILEEIEYFTLPLSPIMKAFHPLSKVGCGNCINVKEHQEDSSNCDVSDRDHSGETHPKFKSGKFLKTIDIAKVKYNLRIGK
ncbi:AHH domain-containing protein [Pseudoalteromonas piscicida]|uniref:AHH domain-containing protein n=2 Tax=Pseudoalteromonas TaxID=53246 RepID=A0A8I2KN26_9GAMM|nr:MULTISPECIES: AHH domain-containing protein [Pseudoalteromonas]ATD08778.1 hypothetical protein PPIS_a4104 [Pseudoalteromonas piscicida]NLR23930.1 hypothetical protein [Pseudoalteromonas maricaloris]WOX29049.1 AHH domain-containing protein [Pseudoalteromonas maricaloris]WPU30775.1 AHH domain-containing protein [Pseudoalteromonas piscicida]